MNHEHAIAFFLSIYLLSCLGTIDYVSTIAVPMNPKVRKQTADIEYWTSDEISKLNKNGRETQLEHARLTKLLMLQGSLNVYRELNEEYQSWIADLVQDKQGGPIPSKITERSALLVKQWDAIQRTAEALGYPQKRQN